MSRLARLRARAARALWLLVVLAVAGEVGLRLYDHAVGRPTGSLYQYVVPGESRFAMRPGTFFVQPERYGDVEYRFNRQGYRDDDHDPERPARRILVLGDSVSFGLGVDQEAIWPRRLEAALAERYGGGYEVVNLAIFAYDTRSELAALEEDGLAYRPAVVILQFYMNDFSIPERPTEADQEVPLRWRLVAAKNRILYASNLYRRLRQGVTALTYASFHDLRRRRFPETLNDAEPRHKSSYLAARPDDREVPAFVALGEIKRRAESQGAELLLFVSPDEVQLYDDRWDSINRRIAAFCAGEEIALFDPLPELRAHPARYELFLDGVHLSRRGHEIITGMLLEEMERRGYLPSSAGEAVEGREVSR